MSVLKRKFRPGEADRWESKEGRKGERKLSSTSFESAPFHPLFPTNLHNLSTRLLLLLNLAMDAPDHRGGDEAGPSNSVRENEEGRRIIASSRAPSFSFEDANFLLSSLVAVNSTPQVAIELLPRRLGLDHAKSPRRLLTGRRSVSIVSSGMVSSPFFFPPFPRCLPPLIRWFDFRILCFWCLVDIFTLLRSNWSNLECVSASSFPSLPTKLNNGDFKGTSSILLPI